MTLYWQAGQERVVREARARMTELYVGVRDGYAAAQVAAGAWKGHADLPEYARNERRTKTGEDLIREWGHLARPREELH